MLCGARPHGDNGSRPLGDSLSPTKTPERARKEEREARVGGEVTKEEFGCFCNRFTASRGNHQMVEPLNTTALHIGLSYFHGEKEKCF